jgi:hypothetical protein
MLALQAVVLVAFIMLLFATDSPRFCAGVYTGLAALGAVLEIVMGDVHIVAGILDVMLAGVLSWGYFTALHRMNPWTGAWWAVAVGGPILAGVVAAGIG